MHRRLEEEIVRSVRSGASFSVLSIDLGTQPFGREEVATAVVGMVRCTDALGWGGDAELVVVLRDTREAIAPAGRLLDAVGRFAPGARAGFARCPDDGCDADTLLLGAREAARCAAPRFVASVAEVAQVFTLEGGTIVALDPAMKRIFGLLERLSSSDLPVLLAGETGTGKEIAASALHAWSPRKGGRMVAINCAALPEPLFESELFGHERGAFSGAISTRTGHLEMASGGTVLLDEIGECSPSAQAKLLRAIETKRAARLGSSIERPLDVRVVAATNRCLEDEVAKGRFRQDLLYRLCGATVEVPPLRDRRLDLPVLARLFLAEARARLARPTSTLAPDTVASLSRYAWPGNVRELKHLMDYLAVTVDVGPVTPSHLPARILGAPARDRGAVGSRAFRNIHEQICAIERSEMIHALEATGGVRTEAAKLIGMPLRTFVTKLKKYAITTPPGRRTRRSS